jgi:hypothetical protein
MMPTVNYPVVVMASQGVSQIRQETVENLSNNPGWFYGFCPGDFTSKDAVFVKISVFA